MPKRLRSGEQGWLHPIHAENRPVVPQRREPPAPPKIDAAALMRQYLNDASDQMIKRLADHLGVGPNALRWLQCGWSREHSAFAFPMKDGDGKTVGIRLRSWGGSKWAVKGSHQGVFLPTTIHDSGPVLLPEGPTDTAACLSLGFQAIGRPSCSGGMEPIVQLVRSLRIRKAVVLADIDDEQELKHGRNPGMAGAQMLQDALPIPSAILALPAKDVRAFLKNGGTKKMVDDFIKNLMWRYPKKG